MCNGCGCDQLRKPGAGKKVPTGADDLHEHWHVHADGTAHTHAHDHEHGESHQHAHHGHVYRPLQQGKAAAPPTPSNQALVKVAATDAAKPGDSASGH